MTMILLNQGVAQPMEKPVNQEIESFVRFLEKAKNIDPKKEIEIQKWILTMILDES